MTMPFTALTGPVCREQHCQDRTEFDPNTGKDTYFCSDHSLENFFHLQDSEDVTFKGIYIITFVKH